MINNIKIEPQQEAPQQCHVKIEKEEEFMSSSHMSMFRQTDNS